MSEKVTKTALISRMILLSAVNSFACLYSLCIFQTVFFKGGGGGSHDFGLATLIPAWLLASAWSALFCLDISTKIMGRKSIAGFLWGGPLSIFTSAVFSYIVIFMETPDEKVGRFFEFIFKIMTLGGLLSEGRSGTASGLAMYCVNIFLGTLSGLCVTFWRQNRRPPLLSILFIPGFLLLPMRAYSYGGTIHSEILTGQAILLLHTTTTAEGYGELVRQGSNIQFGTLDEDGFDAIAIPRVRNHFYRPTDGSGILLFDSARKKLDDSRFFDIAIARYMSGGKSEAFKSLGHVLHLATQDMFSAPHVHNDIHFTLEDVFPGATFAPNSYETWTTNHVNEILTSRLHSANFVPEISGSASFILDQNARATYSAVLIGGAVSKDIASPASGEISTMFPPTNAQTVVFVPQARCLVRDTPSNCLMWEAEWLLTGVGDCFEFAGCAGSPTASDEWWKAQNLNAPVGTYSFYIEDSGVARPANYRGRPSGNMVLAQLWALGNELPDGSVVGEQLVAKGQAASAAMMRYFARQVDRLPPKIEMHKDNLDGALIEANAPNGGINTNASDVFVHIVDPKSAAYPTPSGPYRAVLSRFDPPVSESSVEFLPVDNTADHLFPGLAGGRYQIKAFDGLGNESIVDFQVVNTPPTLRLINADGESLDHGSVSENAVVTVFASHNPAPVHSLEFFIGNALNETVIAPSDTLDMAARREFTGESWHYARTCDVALNCIYSLFGVFASGSTPPNPPPPPPPCPGCKQWPNVQPLPPSEPPNAPPPPPWPPLPPGPPTPPICRGESCLDEPPAPEAPWKKKPKWPKFCDLTPRNCNIPIAFPHDPNAMYGPAGSVTPGQLMTYTVEFENEGQGLALETFVRDTLDPALDGATLIVRDMRRVNFLTEAETSANFPWSYDSRTRTLTVQTGDADSRQGGRFIVEARLKADTAPGTFITNQAVVHFPNSLEVTPTNSIVSAVPLPSQLAYEGASSAAYRGTARFAARLSAGGRPLVDQPVEFAFAGSSWIVTTDGSGLAAISTPILTLPGAYSLQMRFVDDGLLYTAREALVEFAVLKKAVRLGAPFSGARSTETARFAIDLLDDEGHLLSAQQEDPKTIRLELLESGGATTPLGTALLSGASAAFEIALPRPLQISWSVRARFDGDLRYAAATSTGFLRLIDQTAPVISILAPVGARSYSNSESIAIQFSGQDSEDPAPSVMGVVVSSAGQEMTVSNGVAISASSLSPGQWSLVVLATDWAGNQVSAQGPAFQVLGVPDVLPPRTTLSATQPQAGSNPLYITSETIVGFVAMDDLTTIGDGIGTGVSRTEYTMDGGTSTRFAGYFTLSTEGAHNISFFSTDFAGNVEVTQTRALFMDITPPLTRLLIGGLPTLTTDVLLTANDILTFSIEDTGAGPAVTFLDVDGSTRSGVAVSSFTLSIGTHTLAFYSKDNVGNSEVPRAVALTVRAADETPPTLALAPPNGSTVTTASPQIIATYSDIGRGIDAASVRLFLDGVDVTTLAFVTVSSAAFTPSAALAQGTHVAAAQVADLAGNRASSTSTFLVDSIAPITTLLVNGLPAGSTSIVLISTDSLGFAATDGGAGVLESRYMLDGSTVALVFSSTFSLSGGTHSISFRSQDRAGNLEALHTAALTVLGQDVTPPSLALTPASGSTVTTASPQILATYADPGRGVNAASVRLSFDGVDVTTWAVVTASSASFVSSAAIAQGTHTATAQVADLAGNRASSTSTFLVDSIAPVTTLLKNGLATSATSLLLLSTDTVGFSAADAGSGVQATRYALDASTAEVVYASPFTLAVGTHALTYRSLDRAGNAESPRLVSISVASPSSDTTPPLVRLDFPGGAGVEQAVGGVVNVRGAASDASSLTWKLEAAPGAGATSGFTSIAAGANNLSGLIAAWNTTSLSGYQTVRLSATDAFGNTASAAAIVFVGKPIFNFAIGRKDSNVIVNKIKNPTGIVIRSDGKIWVAGTDDDNLLLLTSSGVVVADIDGSSGQGHGHDDDDGQGLRNPQGMALDATDNLYIADKGNDRILKLSPNGATVLLDIAKHDSHGRPKPGSGNGELRQPQDVAVDLNGDIYAADSGNHRIQVFSAVGAYLRQFGPGVLLSTAEIRGIALTSEGLWVSDRDTERVYLFSRAGAFIKSIGAADSAVGELSRMRGLASDRLGSLYVIEPNRDRTQKFDPQGKGLFAFGSKDGLSQADKQAKRYLTQPIDAAVAPDGSIWITDTGRDRIVRYTLPTSGGYGVASYSAGGGEIVSNSIEPAKRVVDHNDGAKVERDDGAGVHIPKGALAADLEITVDKGDENQDKEQKDAKRQEKKVAAASQEVQYGPEGTTFSAPVTLTIPYDAALIASRGISEDSLKVYYWNPTLKDWEIIPSTVDKAARTVSAQTSHFSSYQVGGLGGIGVAAIDDFGYRDGYAFPNPSRNGASVTFRMQPGSADSIEVRVYDVSGRKIHSSSDFRFLGAFDDGNGKGAQDTYDHVWDVSGVGSGVYNFVITAKKAGQSDIRKSGKVGVIR